MSRPHAIRAMLIRVLPVACLVLGVLAPAAGAAPFSIGIQDPRPLDGGQHLDRFDTLRSMGSDVTRITMFWNIAAARCGSVPTHLLANHLERCYDWSATDGAVRTAGARGIDVLISVYGAPQWVTGSTDIAFTGAARADFDRFAARYADFAQAAATRYSATSAHGFVRYWTVWNEPNGGLFWKPAEADAPVRYADLYAQAAARMKAASPTTLVAPGPTAPKSLPFKPGVFIPVVQRRLEQLGASHLVDAWAHNPYTGSNVTPYKPYNLRLPSIGIGNMGDMFGLLDSSPVTKGKPVWATEFAYQTNPPDVTLGVDPQLQSIWMAEAMDVAWSTGRMPIFEWYMLKDPDAAPALDWDSGLFTRFGTEKPAAGMFRRPVAVRKLGTGQHRVWGMSAVHPESAELVQRASGSSAWAPLAAQRHEGGVLVAVGALRPGTAVAVRDVAGVGPERVVDTAWADPQVALPVGLPPVPTSIRLAHPRLSLSQRRAGARRAARCGSTLVRRCAYRRTARVAFRATMQPGRAMTLSTNWQRRVGGRWRSVTSVRQVTPTGAVTYGLPARVRGRAGTYRVRTSPARAGAADPSAWQYLTLR